MNMSYQLTVNNFCFRFNMQTSNGYYQWQYMCTVDLCQSNGEMYFYETSQRKTTFNLQRNGVKKGIQKINTKR